MKLEDVVKEDSPIEDFEKLVSTPFTLTPQGIYVLSKATQNQGKLTNYYDHSAIFTTFFGYVAHQLNKDKLEGEAEIARFCIKNLQSYNKIPQEHKSTKEKARKEFTDRLGYLKSSSNIDRVNQIFGSEWWHFLYVTEKSSELAKQREDRLTISHYMNNALENVANFYRKATGFELSSAKNKWRTKFS